MSSVSGASKSVDARGLFCPEPLFRAKTEIEFLNQGEILEVLADDPAAESDFSSWTKRTGHQLLVLERNGRDMRILIRKK